EAHAEKLRSRGLVVAGLLQRLHDRVALDVLELSSESSAAFGGARRRSCQSRRSGSFGVRRRTDDGAQLDVLAGDDACRAEGQCALEHVLQLADVARKRVALQRTQG